MTYATLPSADRILATVSDLVALGSRATGTPGGAKAAEYVADRFRAAGLSDVGFEETDSYAWAATACTLRVGDLDVTCAPIRHCLLPGHEAVGTFTTGPDGLAADVVDIGAGPVGETDVRGKVVLFDLAFEMSLSSLLPFSLYVHDPGRRMLRRDVLSGRNPYVTSLTRVMEQAASAGALAVIGVLRDYPESVGYHNEYYRRSVLSLPGVWVTRRAGEEVRREIGRGASRAVLRLDVERRLVTARTVVGVLPGRTTETVMVQSHHDSVGPGAVQDGTGTAEVIALAEHFCALARRGARRAKTMAFVTFDSHFTGYHAHRAFAEKYVLQERTPYRIVLNATIEHIGLRAVAGPDGSFRTTGTTEPRGFFENLNPKLKLALIRAIRRHGLEASTLVNASLMEFTRYGIPTDASFTLVSGVPTVSLVSGPLYLYDDADTLDKVAVDQLVPVARAFVDLLDAVDRSAGSRLGLIPERLRRRLPRGRW